jgi:catechol 2,3-dioxygenase-like lactoylglutathione lyase family enzyme
MKSNIDTHGRIKCVTIATPLLARSLSDYRRIFGFVSIEDGTLDEDLAEAWAAPSSAGKRYALLQHKSGGDSFIRLVEGTQVLEYVALRSFGWASITFAINDLASLHENIDADGAFAILSVPSPKTENSGPMSAAICGQAHEIVTLKSLTRLLQRPIGKPLLIIISAPFSLKRAQQSRRSAQSPIVPLAWRQSQKHRYR